MIDKTILEQIFSEIEKYESRYGIAMPIQAYLRLKNKWMKKVDFYWEDLV
jgi:hypothetical protein